MTIRRRTASGLVLLVGAAALASVGPAQAATWLPGVSVSDDAPDAPVLDDHDVVVDDDGTATAVWTVEVPIEDEPFAIDVVQVASRTAGAPDFEPVQALGPGTKPDIVAHPDGSVTVAWQQGAQAVVGDAAGRRQGVPSGRA